ncbi:hypothetical protein ACJX0J_009517 [Zea mays]
MSCLATRIYVLEMFVGSVGWLVQHLFWTSCLATRIYVLEMVDWQFSNLMMTCGSSNGCGMTDTLHRSHRFLLPPGPDQNLGLRPGAASKTYKGKKLQKLQVESRMHKYITRMLLVNFIMHIRCENAFCYLQHAIITFTCYSSKKNLFKKKMHNIV